MTSYVFDIGERARKASRFIGHVRTELQRALVFEKKERKITQQQIANLLGVNRSVINRQLMGTDNLTLRSIADLAWALNWDIAFELKKQNARDNDDLVARQGYLERGWSLADIRTQFDCDRRRGSC